MPGTEGRREIPYYVYFYTFETFYNTELKNKTCKIRGLTANDNAEECVNQNSNLRVSSIM